MGETVPRVSAADVGMHADEPDLADPFVIDMRLFRIRTPRRRPALIDRNQSLDAAHIAIVPQHRAERVALLLERQGMAGPADLVVHELVGHRQRPVEIIDGARDLLDRAAIGVDGVPDAEKIEFFDFDPLELLECRLAEDEMADPIAQAAQRLDQDIIARAKISGLAVFAVGDLGIARQVLLVTIVLDEPHPRDEAGDNADRECAAAESKTEYPVAGMIVAATERIDIDDVAFQPDAENPAEDCERLEGGSADAIVVIGDLLQWIFQVQRLIEAPDVGLEQF